jgi:hypothetical protein
MRVGGGGTPPFTYALKIDGVVKSTQTTSSLTASYTWRTVQEAVAPGSHTLALSVTDATSKVSTVSHTVTVDNGAALQVFITGVTAGQTVSGNIWPVLWIKNAGSPPFGYQLSVGGQVMASQTSSSTGPVSLLWDTTRTPNGPQTLVATVNTALKSGSASIDVVVQNGPPPGLTATITAPAEGATVSGTTPVALKATGGTPNYTFTLKVNGTIEFTRGGPDTTATYSWPTADGHHPNGTYTLDLTVTDGGGRTATAPRRTVTVNNDTPPPGDLKIWITSPKAGAPVSGTVWTTVWVDPPGTAPYTYKLSVTTAAGTQPAFTQMSASAGPVSLPWDSKTATDGPATLTATVTDAAGKSGAASVSVTAQNGTGLTASITSPANGATVSATVTIGLAARGGTSPYRYAVTVDTTPLPAVGPTGATAWQSWDTRTVANGAHTLTLTVTDSAGATATARVTVTVDNGGTVSPLKVAMTSPKPGATVSGNVWPTVWVDPPATAPFTYKLLVTTPAGTKEVWSQPSSSTGPVTLFWDSRTAPNGPVSLTATVADAAGRSGSTSVSVTVQNP